MILIGLHQERRTVHIVHIMDWEDHACVIAFGDAPAQRIVYCVQFPKFKLFQLDTAAWNYRESALATLAKSLGMWCRQRSIPSLQSELYVVCVPVWFRRPVCGGWQAVWLLPLHSMHSMSLLVVGVTGCLLHTHDKQLASGTPRCSICWWRRTNCGRRGPGLATHGQRKQ